MFYSNSCHGRSFTQFPLFINDEKVIGLRNLLLVCLLALAFLGLFWLGQYIRQKYRFSRSKLILSLIAITTSLAILLALAPQGLVVLLPQDTGETVEAIVILGRGQPFRKRRVEEAAQLWRAKRAPGIFVSGIGDTPYIITLLQENGIPDQAIDGENCSLSTPQNAIFSAAILQARGIDKILLVTDPPHMWRSLLEFQEQGFTVISHLSPLPANWSIQEQAFLTFREYLFLINSSVKRLFQEKDSAILNSIELQNLVQKAEQYGKQKRSH